jgi:hypothetical protein
MKRCTYCGKEYDDTAIVCVIDRQPVGKVSPEKENCLWNSGIGPFTFITLIIIGVLLLFLAGALLFWAPREGEPRVSLAVGMNSLTQASNRMTFLMRNEGQRAILLTDMFVETNSAIGWHAFSHNRLIPNRPNNWLVVTTGQTEELAISPPNSGPPWRLRVAYATDVRGPMRVLYKAKFALSQRRWPPSGLGIMHGSNSCTSGEISK